MNPAGDICPNKGSERQLLRIAKTLILKIPKQLSNFWFVEVLEIISVSSFVCFSNYRHDKRKNG